MELLSDQLPPLVDAADARQKLTTVVAPGRGAVDSDVSLATQSADLCELLFALGDQLLPLGDQVRVVSQNLRQEPLAVVAPVLAKLEQGGERKDKTVHGLAPAALGRAAERGGAGFWPGLAAVAWRSSVIIIPLRKRAKRIKPSTAPANVPRSVED